MADFVVLEGQDGDSLAINLDAVAFVDFPQPSNRGASPEVWGVAGGEHPLLTIHDDKKATALWRELTKRERERNSPA